MRVTTAAALGMVVLTGAWALGSLTVSAQGNSNNITMLDDCDPTTRVFHHLRVSSPEATSRSQNSRLLHRARIILIGHPSWRNEPSHLTSGQVGRSGLERWRSRTHVHPGERICGGTIGGLNAGSLALTGAQPRQRLPPVVLPGVRPKSRKQPGTAALPVLHSPLDAGDD